MSGQSVSKSLSVSRLALTSLNLNPHERPCLGPASETVGKAHCTCAVHLFMGHRKSRSGSEKVEGISRFGSWRGIGLVTSRESIYKNSNVPNAFCKEEIRARACMCLHVLASDLCGNWIGMASCTKTRLRSLGLGPSRASAPYFQCRLAPRFQHHFWGGGGVEAPQGGYTWLKAVVTL